MTDNDILVIAEEIDHFIKDTIEGTGINIIDLSAIVNSRLKTFCVAEQEAEDYEDLMNHLNSQTITVPRTIH
jgi:hypothetical protein